MNVNKQMCTIIRKSDDDDDDDDGGDDNERCQTEADDVRSSASWSDV